MFQRIKVLGAVAPFLPGVLGWRRMLAWCAVVLLLLQAVGAVAVFTGPQEWKVYIRNILFSDFYGDARLRNEAALDAAVARGFDRDARPQDYLPYLEPAAARSLKAFQAAAKPTDRELAHSIIQYLGDSRESKICGIDSLGKVVFDTTRGQGCCSDFSKAWMFYALYLGLQVREVNSLNHTTVEYFDRQARRWVWVDPFNRVEIVDDAGQPFSQYQLRVQTLFDRANFRRLPGSHEDFEPPAYNGYAPAQLAVLSWRKGVNFLQVEAWDARLRTWGLPKSMRQLVLLSLDIQPKWLVLTTDALALYLNALKVLAWGLLALLATLNATLAVLAVRRRQERG